MKVVHKQEETPAQREERQTLEHNSLLDRIRTAQIRSAEEVVIQDLRDKGLVD